MRLSLCSFPEPFPGNCAAAPRGTMAGEGVNDYLRAELDECAGFLYDASNLVAAVANTNAFSRLQEK